MIRLSIRAKIMAIAVGLIVPMGVAAVLSMVMVVQVGNQLEKITDSYIPAYGDLARTNIRSLERSLALRRMVFEKMQTPFNADKFAAFRDTFNAKGEEVEHEAGAARAVIKGLMGAKAGDVIKLALLEGRVDTAMNDARRHLIVETGRLLP